MRNLLVATALLLSLAAAGCRGRTPDIGRPCSPDEPCPAQMHCLPDYEGDPVCMESCSDTTDATCGDGSLCVGTTLGERACWIGGPVGIDGACETSLDCAQGGVCIVVFGEAQAFCHRACTPGREYDCYEGERCVPTDDPSVGFCAM